MGKIKVVMCPADRAPYVTNISNTLQNLQKIVGGYIEESRIAPDIVAVFNEEGRLKNLPPNLSFPVEGIVGDAVIMGVDDEGQEVDLTDEQAAFLLAHAKRRWNRMAHGE